MKLWCKWCEKVDRHNAKLDYAASMEAWGYDTPLLPIFEGILLGLIVVLGFYLKDKNLVYAICSGVKTFIASSLILGTGLYVNWKVYE